MQRRTECDAGETADQRLQRERRVRRVAHLNVMHVERRAGRDDDRRS